MIIRHPDELIISPSNEWIFETQNRRDASVSLSRDAPFTMHLRQGPKTEIERQERETTTNSATVGLGETGATCYNFHFF